MLKEKCYSEVNIQIFLCKSMNDAGPDTILSIFALNGLSTLPLNKNTYLPLLVNSFTHCLQFIVLLFIIKSMVLVD